MNKSNNNFPKVEEINSKLKSEIISTLEQYYETDCSKLNDYSFYMVGKEKVYIFSGQLIPTLFKRVNSMGLYFLTIHKNFRLRLSTEGVNFIKPKINYVVLNDDSLNSFISGENLFLDEVNEVKSNDKAPFLILIYKTLNLGTVSKKDQLLISYIPKSRKLDYNKLY